MLNAKRFCTSQIVKLCQILTVFTVSVQYFLTTLQTVIKSRPAYFSITLQYKSLLSPNDFIAISENCTKQTQFTFKTPTKTANVDIKIRTESIRSLMLITNHKCFLSQPIVYRLNLKNSRNWCEYLRLHTVIVAVFSRCLISCSDFRFSPICLRFTATSKCGEAVCRTAESE